ncbi:PfkB family carbohydrate kinase, partial [Candidatus Caldipriscus sp.]|nr:PfkB family carbohydrate kinase [Candidatus Caldipriscus sp.]
MKIAVIGDVMLDEYAFGSVERISPEAPVPVFLYKSSKFMPGGAANVALNLVRLGFEVYLFGIIGEDEDGERLANL